MTERQIGLRKRTKPFTPVPNGTVDDFTISFRELGLLTRILRMPEGFVIRSEQLANEGRGTTLRGREPAREGREAIRTTLRNLALGGYYRLVRQSMRNGTFEMATDVSEDRVDVWAAQALIFGGHPVRMVQQEDGSYHVKYPDGTLLPDGEMPPDHLLQQAKRDAEGKRPTRRQPPKPKNPSPAEPGQPGPKNPAPGQPASGEPGPLSKRVKEDGQQDSVPASQERPAQDKIGHTFDGQINIDGEVEVPEPVKVPTPRDVAFGVAHGWIDYRAKINKPVAGSRPLHQLQSLVEQFVKAGYTEDEIKRGLNGLAEAIPSKAAMQRALDTIRDRRTPGVAGRPVQQRGAGARVNDHWRQQEDKQPVSVGAAAPRADRIQTEGGDW